MHPLEPVEDRGIDTDRGAWAPDRCVRSIAWALRVGEDVSADRHSVLEQGADSMLGWFRSVSAITAVALLNAGCTNSAIGPGGGDSTRVSDLAAKALEVGSANGFGVTTPVD